MRKPTHVSLTMTQNIDVYSNWDNINFPSSNADIRKLEDHNEGHLSINVYRISSDLLSEPISLYRRSEITKATYEIDLSKLEEGDHCHYANIKSPNNKKKQKQIMFVDNVLMVSVQKNV